MLQLDPFTPNTKLGLNIFYYIFHLKVICSNKLYKNKFMLNVIRSNTDKRKKSLAYVFDNCCQPCCVLIPSRCKNLSDICLTENKNIICRVINKGTLTKTEVGQFYIPKRVFYL
jgi:hypothetical protein